MKVVLGYLPIDALPRKARRLGLVHRTSFVLESYRPDRTDDYFDAELYATLVDVVRRTVRADKAIATLVFGKTTDLAAGGDFERQLLTYVDDERGPLSEISFLHSSSIVAIVGSEPYAHVGGPPPYHDSYTAPVFSREDISKALEQETQVVCKRLGANIKEVIVGERMVHRQTPLEFLLRNLKRLFGW